MASDCPGCCTDDPHQPFYLYFSGPPFDGGTCVGNPQPGIPCTWFGEYHSGGWRIEWEISCVDGALQYAWNESQWQNGAWVPWTGNGGSGFFTGAAGPLDCTRVDFTHPVAVGGTPVTVRVQGKLAHDATGQ